MNNIWNERFATEEYIYGKKPNDFLVSIIDKLPKGKILSIGEGEGRNAIYLAQLGYEVTALDGSAVGLEKAKRLAIEVGVTIQTIVADLSTYVFEENAYDGIVSFFCHLPSEIRKKVHQSVVKSLKVGGVYVLEGYAKEQINYNTGGPASLDLLYSLPELKQELSGLTFEIERENKREIQEGRMHSGTSYVVQILAKK